MSMESVLKKLESKIEEFVEAHGAATERVSELEGRVEELEGQLAEGSELADRVKSLEGQRDQLAKRLEKVLATIDDALGKAGKDTKQ
jgi:chaperonin cofactor prefoldin